MTQFEKAIKDKIKCDICGKLMVPIYGWGWDYDIMGCPDRECGAVIVYPTSTEIVEKEG